MGRRTLGSLIEGAPFTGRPAERTGPGGLDLTPVEREHSPMAIPDYQTAMLPVLRAAADGEVRISESVEKLATEFGLTEDERAELLPSWRH